jgi:hypothetical protein
MNRKICNIRTFQHRPCRNGSLFNFLKEKRFQLRIKLFLKYRIKLRVKLFLKLRIKLFLKLRIKLFLNLRVKLIL